MRPNDECGELFAFGSLDLGTDGGACLGGTGRHSAATEDPFGLGTASTTTTTTANGTTSSSNPQTIDDLFAPTEDSSIKGMCILNARAQTIPG